MVRAVDGLGEGDEQARHQQEDRGEAQQDRLDEHHAHIHAEPELHEGQGQQAGDGGEAAGGDLGNGLAQRGDGGLPGRLVLMLLHVAVAEDDGVVDGQRELQDDGDGVGDEGDLAHQVVGAHVQQGRRAEGDQKHRDLRVGPGGKEQHQDDDDHRDQVHHQHLLIDYGLERVAHLAVHVEIVARELLLHRGEGADAELIVVRTVEGDEEQGGGGGVVVLRLIEAHGFDALDLLDARQHGIGLIVGNVLHHDLRGGIGGELAVHQLNTPAGLGLLTEVVGQRLVDLHPFIREGAENAHRREQEEEQPAFVDDEGGQTRHEIGLVVVLHGSPLTKKPEPRRKASEKSCAIWLL